jgi:transposase-like protein
MEGAMPDTYWRPNVVSGADGKRYVYLLKPWQVERANQAHLAIKCKHCGAEEAVRYGTSGKTAPKQRFKCGGCGRTFVANNAPPGMRFPAQAIATSLNMFYEASSLSKIQRQIKLDTGLDVDPSTVYRWVARYTKKAVGLFAGVTVKLGPVVVADETVIKLKSYGGENVWLWDAISRDTRYLIATHISPTRNTPEAEDFLQKVKRGMGGKKPEILLTDGLRAYLGGAKEAFGADTKHRRGDPFDKGPENTRDIERLHGTLKDRVKVLRSMANRESAKLVIAGWTVHYNFFRPHSGLDNRTPAYAAGHRGQVKSWRDVVEAE